MSNVSEKQILGTELEAIQRRVNFASACRYFCDSTLNRLKIRRGVRLRHALYGIGGLVFDLAEWLRTGIRPRYIGQANFAALHSPGQLSQHPRYRGYWYDATNNTLVGMHLGLDLIRHDGKYFVIESNICAALPPERRSLFDTEIDPLVSELVRVAKIGGFERVILLRGSWSEAYLEEFKIATQESGIEIIGASTREYKHRAKTHMPALPKNLEANTVYVIDDAQPTPLSIFVNDKLCSATWLREEIESNRGEIQYLSYAPTYPQLMLPEKRDLDPIYPNLVVKLSSADQGLFIAMGRFDTEEQARRELKLRGPNDVPGVFRIGFIARLMNRIFRNIHVAYQPFIPSELIEGKASKIRLNLFISPLVNSYLSAFAVIAHHAPTDVEVTGMTHGPNPYMVSFGPYRRLPIEIEHELRTVAEEFGRVASWAISKKFVTTPDHIDRRAD